MTSVISESEDIEIASAENESTEVTTTEIPAPHTGATICNTFFTCLED
ncbi:13611_t:CDS:2 [Cetraspora pellucida]|uniref:13611_t:CDS:1 n=1 Tax=Cetraspora pellucida TaxID=1433469 RepID=A0A9N9FPJ2_9GLOM|nr:13611_t:CDS:2 [Cetraspora pellucida]